MEESVDDDLDVSGIVRNPYEEEGFLNSSGGGGRGLGSGGKKKKDVSSEKKKKGSKSSPTASPSPTSSFSFTKKPADKPPDTSVSTGTSANDPPILNAPPQDEGNKSLKRNESINNTSSARSWGNNEKTNYSSNLDDKKNTTISSSSANSNYNNNNSIKTNNYNTKPFSSSQLSNDNVISDFVDDSEETIISKSDRDQKSNVHQSNIVTFASNVSNDKATLNDKGNEQLLANLRSSISEKDLVEKRLRNELEELKVKLVTLDQHPIKVSSFANREDQDVRLVQDQLEHKRLVTQLELEIMRLKDESNIKQRKHQEELKYLQNKYELELQEMKLKNEIEIESVERRHSESISALKSIHTDEILSIKERNKSGQLFEQIAGQIQSSTGSIKLIEEQLNAKYRGLEAAREGQMEARERLLSEMEEKARERADLAEQEAYKLKGILSHMDHVVESLRTQSSEEKERLRSEHQRLQILQQTLDKDKTAQHTRNMEELSYIKQRSKEIESELNKLNQEKQIHYDNLNAAQRRLDLERADFQSYMSSHKRNLEDEQNRLRDEEITLKKQRDDLMSDKHSFELRKNSSMKQIIEIEEMRLAVSLELEQVRREREQLKSIARDIQITSETLQSREQALKDQTEALEMKESTLKEGIVVSY